MPSEPPSNPFSRPSIWPASSRAGLRITPTPDLTGRTPPPGEPPRARRPGGVVTGAAVPGADPAMNRHAPRAAGAEPAPQPQPSAQSQNQSQSQSQSHSQSNGAAPDEAEIDPRRAASAAFERRMSAAGRPVRPAPEPAAITLGAEWTPLQRRRRQDRRIRALVAYGAGAVALVVTVGVVLGVVQRRADISIAARAAPPVESPAALPPEPMAPLPSVEAADGGLRGAAEVAEPPRVAMVRIDGQSATAPSAAPPRRRAPVRAAEPPIITPPPPATVPSPLDEPEALLLDIAPTPAQPATPMASPAP